MENQDFFGGLELEVQGCEMGAGIKSGPPGFFLTRSFWELSIWASIGRDAWGWLRAGFDPFSPFSPPKIVGSGHKMTAFELVWERNWRNFGVP